MTKNTSKSDKIKIQPDYDQLNNEHVMFMLAMFRVAVNHNVAYCMQTEYSKLTERA